MPRDDDGTVAFRGVAASVQMPRSASQHRTRAGRAVLMGDALRAVDGGDFLGAPGRRPN